MAAEQPPDGPGLRPRRGWWIAAGLLAGLLVVGLLAALWIKAPALYGRGDAAKTAAATTRGAILTVAAALIAATAAGAGLYMTARTIRDNQKTIQINQQALAKTQRANAETARANREADQRDRYAKAIDQLGSNKLDVRLGGIYGLERIAKTSEQDHPIVVEVLGVYVRQHTDPTRRRRRPPPTAVQNKAPPQPAVDVQAAVSVLGRLPPRDRVPRGDLTGAHLAGARLGRANLAGAQLAVANLAGADLEGADLTGAGLIGADLTTAKNLIQQQLDSARGDSLTKLPVGLQRPAHWSADLAAPPAADR